MSGMQPVVCAHVFIRARCYTWGSAVTSHGDGQGLFFFFFLGKLEEFCSLLRSLVLPCYHWRTIDAA